MILENLTLAGGLAQGTGFAAVGGAIYSSGTLTLSGVTVKSNLARGTGTTGTGGAGNNAFGGGLFVETGAVTLRNDTLSKNYVYGGHGDSAYDGYTGGTGHAGVGGGMYVAAGTVTLSDDTLNYCVFQGDRKEVMECLRQVLTALENPNHSIKVASEDSPL